MNRLPTTMIKPLLVAISSAWLSACASTEPPLSAPAAAGSVQPAALVSGSGLPDLPSYSDLPSYYGTLHPFASKAVYFVLTDRFVDGDPANNFADSSGYNRPIELIAGSPANVGYLGGDFKGLLSQADYIAEMGFGAVWMTPIVDNPAQAFSGGDRIQLDGFGMDLGKSAYHGYWASNFYQVDEHLPSADLNYQQLTAGLQQHGLTTVLDVVINHGSPAYSMPTKQPEYGQIFAEDGRLLADHGNLAPEQLDRSKPLQAMFANKRDLTQLADFDFSDPQVMDYLVGAYLKWLGQGAGAFRLDTVKHVSPEVWQQFSTRIRTEYPDLFMFGEVYSFDAEEIGKFTFDNAGGMSVLDFPQKQALAQVLEQGAGFETLLPTLFLDGNQGTYANPYELTTFYDNHDMPRVDTSDEGFINAHNWLFTARGIPVIYYGSEIGFERGKGEHLGNRNYFGVERIEQAKQHPIRQAMMRIAKVRQQSVALQRGLMLPLEMQGDRAAFMRVYQHDGVAQQALVLLNKGNSKQRFSHRLQAGDWQEALSAATSNGVIEVELPANSVQVWLLDAPVMDSNLAEQLQPLLRL
ncbi:alpha-amylase family glycosyl hydrolase [Ferrimonas senticii]|uniref:alpha-amylase family glycosyl hydrolase n=1 Tax=Ferrimonas senticii TaxID=394566 RepID=UPI000418E447|nr:alpha-amylase family glycosyl hydrolase [Ferrimonas senticii]